MEELSRKLPQLPWIIAVVGLAIAGWFFFSVREVSTELGLRQSEADIYKLQLSQYEKLMATYGRGSDKFYADKSLLILQPEGEATRITVYCGDIEDKATQHASFKPLENITLDWANNWHGEGNYLVDLIVTPGKNAGCYPVTLTNNVNDDTFQVLVVVK